MKLKHLTLLLLVRSCLFAQEQPDQELPCLCNAKQLTFLEMGFDRAGEAYFSPDGQSIIFQATAPHQHSYQIYTMNLETGIPVRVSTGDGKCTCGFYHPDGQKLLFASSHESPEASVNGVVEANAKYAWEFTPYMQIYQGALDGSELKAITSGPAYHAECAYSPDGHKIVYTSNETGHPHIYVYDLDSGQHTKITHHDHCYNGGPFFSPDGEWILFRADRDSPDILQLFMIRSDGSEEKRLTYDSDVNWAPFWHPSGQVIAYTTSRHGHHAYQIYLLNLQTQEEYRLTHTHTFEGLPSFRDDGTKILWTSKRAGGGPQVWIADFLLPESFLK